MSVWLVIPPMMKYLAGPLLGPSLLIQGAQAKVRLLDLNAKFLRENLADQHVSNKAIGDHCKPVDGFQQANQKWQGVVGECLPKHKSRGIIDPHKELSFTFEEINIILDKMERSEIAEWMKTMLPEKEPKWIGVSLLFSGQVLGALLWARLCKKKYPACPIIFGGAHITALAERISKDSQYGVDVDGFVAGYAEKTFQELCEMNNPVEHPKVFTAGQGDYLKAEEKSVVGITSEIDLKSYGIPRLNIPVQTSRGCAYGKCKFCSYPKIEGIYRAFSLENLEKNIQVALNNNGVLSFKDSLITAKRLKEIGQIIAGRVEWSACTRLLPILSHEMLEMLVSQGLRTLEIGVETIHPRLLHLVNKKQSRIHVLQWLQNVEGLNIHLVLNLMVGFPSETEAEKEEFEKEISRWSQSYPSASFSIEKNIFQLQLQTLLAENPNQYGITIFETYPWTTVCSWNAPEWIEKNKDWRGHQGMNLAA